MFRSIPAPRCAQRNCTLKAPSKFGYNTGGIARASTMSLAHYVLNRHEDPTEAVEKLKAKRSVVLRTAAGYKSVRAISRDLDGA